MFVVSLVTIILLLTSYALNRMRTAEAMLLLPFAAGSLLISFFSVVSFFQMSAGYFILAFFLGFEWLLLTVMGLVLGSLKFHSSGSMQIPIQGGYRRALFLFGLFLIGVLSIYMVGVLFQILAAPSMADYFLFKRSEAHAGAGVDIANPLAYRAISFSMAFILIITSFTFFSTKRIVFFDRFVFFVVFITGSIASLLEGNRSTLIVTLVSLMCFIYIYRLVSMKTLALVFLLFMLFFVISMQVFRLGGEFSLSGFLDSVSWFFLYAFGSLASFPIFLEQHILTYWYTFDVASLKFGHEFAQSIGAREFFIIDYVDVGDLSTNVYSGYAVLYDYLGIWALAFLMVKTIVFYFAKHVGKKNIFFHSCYLVLISSYPLTIYHEFFLTSIYYCVLILEMAVILWLLTCVINIVKRGISTPVLASETKNNYI